MPPEAEVRMVLRVMFLIQRFGLDKGDAEGRVSRRPANRRRPFPFLIAAYNALGCRGPKVLRCPRHLDRRAVRVCDGQPVRYRSSRGTRRRVYLHAARHGNGDRLRLGENLQRRSQGTEMMPAWRDAPSAIIQTRSGRGRLMRRPSTETATPRSTISARP